MTIPIIRFALDPTGINPNNLVANEPHTLTTNVLIRAIATIYGPYYTASLIITDTATGIALGPKQYSNVELLQDATIKYGQEICTLILITDSTVSDTLTVTYQVLGGYYQNSAQAVVSAYETLIKDARPVNWANVINKPVEYPPTLHEHLLEDVYGFESVVASLERVRNAILLKDTPALNSVVDWVWNLFNTEVGVPTIEGPETLYEGQAGTYLITNYNSHTTYLLTSLSGTATINVDTITFTAPLSLVATSFTLNNAIFGINVVAIPVTLSGTNSTSVINGEPTYTLFTNSVNTFTISNYDSTKTYTGTATIGTISISGSIVTYTAPNNINTGSFTIDSNIFYLKIVFPVPALSGPTTIFTDSSNSYTITNYNALDTYTATVTAGTVSISGDIVTVVASNVVETINLTVNTLLYPISVISPPPVLLGSTNVLINSVTIYSISNYNSTAVYAVTAIAGTVSISGNTITYTAPSTVNSNAGFIINGTTETINVGETPVISGQTNPYTSSTYTYTITNFVSGDTYTVNISSTYGTASSVSSTGTFTVTYTSTAGNVTISVTDNVFGAVGYLSVVSSLYVAPYVAPSVNPIVSGPTSLSTNTTYDYTITNYSSGTSYSISLYNTSGGAISSTTNQVVSTSGVFSITTGSVAENIGISVFNDTVGGSETIYATVTVPVVYVPPAATETLSISFSNGSSTYYQITPFGIDVSTSGTTNTSFAIYINGVYSSNVSTSNFAESTTYTLGNTSIYLMDTTTGVVSNTLTYTTVAGLTISLSGPTTITAGAYPYTASWSYNQSYSGLNSTLYLDLTGSMSGLPSGLSFEFDSTTGSTGQIPLTNQSVGFTVTIGYVTGVSVVPGNYYSTLSVTDLYGVVTGNSMAITVSV